MKIAIATGFEPQIVKRVILTLDPRWEHPESVLKASGLVELACGITIREVRVVVTAPGRYPAAKMPSRMARTTCPNGECNRGVEARAYCPHCGTKLDPPPPGRETFDYAYARDESVKVRVERAILDRFAEMTGLISRPKPPTVPATNPAGLGFRLRLDDWLEIDGYPRMTYVGPVDGGRAFRFGVPDRPTVAAIAYDAPFAVGPGASFTVIHPGRKSGCRVAVDAPGLAVASSSGSLSMDEARERMAGKVVA